MDLTVGQAVEVRLRERGQLVAVVADVNDDGAAEDPMLVFNVTDQVRESIQQTLYTLLMKRRSVFS